MKYLLIFFLICYLQIPNASFGYEYLEFNKDIDISIIVEEIKEEKDLEKPPQLILSNPAPNIKILILYTIRF